MSRVTVLGAGAWGTAVATLLAANRHDVMLWCYEQDVVDQINKERTNRYLADISLAPNIHATADLVEAINHSSIIFEAIPVPFLRKTLLSVREKAPHSALWVLLSKGLEQETLLPPSGIIDDLFGKTVRTVVVSGPNFAKDLALQAPTATTVASRRPEWSAEVSNLLSNHYFSTYFSSDPLGAQVGGALKNVITIAIGMLRGAAYRDNTCSFVFTRGLREMAEIARHWAAKRETVYGLSGVGDLVLTATGSLSRNFKLGKLIGEGKSLSEIEQHLPVLPEGANTVQSVKQLMERSGLNLPVCQGVYDTLYTDQSVKDFVERLMKQSGEPEW